MAGDGGSTCGGELGQRGHPADGGAAEGDRSGNSRLEKLANEYIAMVRSDEDTVVVRLDMHTDMHVHRGSWRLLDNHGRVVPGLGRGFLMQLVSLLSAYCQGKFFWAQPSYLRK